MKIHTAFAVEGDPGEPGDLVTKPTEPVVIQTPWPAGAPSKIGIISTFSHMHLYENVDPLIRRVSVVLVKKKRQ